MKLLRFLLFPFAILYDAITSIRNYFFDVGVLKSTSFNIPVIAVGNLSVGGTGKTPQIEYLIRLLKNKHKVAVLSRGYKRKTKGFQLVSNSHLAEDVGDEPLQFFKKFDDITVAVDGNRVNGIANLLASKSKPEVILLDDAYQHRKVKAGLYILLTKFDDLYVDDFILPSGNLRESKRGAKRASIVVVTKCPQNLTENQKVVVKKRLRLKSYQQLFFSTIAYDEWLQGDIKLPITALQNKEVLLVTGIANPKPLMAFLNEKSIKFAHLNFPDHHNFSSDDIQNIEKAYTALKSEEKIILTTEKDYMRLAGKITSISYIGIKNTFLKNEQGFNSLINSFVTK